MLTSGCRARDRVRPFGWRADIRAHTRAGEDVLSATIIVIAANGFMSCLHDGMPVIIAERDFDAWLDAAS